MDLFTVTKLVHILSATVLFGTGLGTAFFMFRSRWAESPAIKYEFARTTVLADYLFTMPAAIIQPLSGFALIHLAGIDPMEFWLAASYGLYILAGLCWLPVVWIQIQFKKMLLASIETGEALPEKYHRLFRLWFLLGWPAFISLIVIFYLMIARPT